ncbi:MAG: collagen-like protein [Oscillospiraceae bacterium]|nr:collagen-like protein [Oscillospiraceae bacterium]
MNKRTKTTHVTDNSDFISLGKAGENKFRTINIDISGWIEENAEYRIIYSRPDGTTYSVPISRNGDTLTWTPEAYDVDTVGFGKLEVRAYIDDAIGKSAIFNVAIDESIQTNETQPGIAHPDWVNDIIDKVVIDKIEQTATSTEDGGLNVFTVTLTNGDTTTFEVRNGNKGNHGDKGDKGDTGDVGPQGIQGEKGDTGADGYTPRRGEDYWTEEDKTEIIQDVLASLPNGDEVSY